MKESLLCRVLLFFADTPKSARSTKKSKDEGRVWESVPKKWKWVEKKEKYWSHFKTNRCSGAVKAVGKSIGYKVTEVSSSLSLHRHFLCVRVERYAAKIPGVFPERAADGGQATASWNVLLQGLKLTSWFRRLTISISLTLQSNVSFGCSQADILQKYILFPTKTMNRYWFYSFKDQNSHAFQ